MMKTRGGAVVKERKTRDEWAVEQNFGYGHGWETVTTEDSYLEAKQRVREYRENQPEYPVRLRMRRVPKAS